jgi:hypothetical protein
MTRRRPRVAHGKWMNGLLLDRMLLHIFYNHPSLELGIAEIGLELAHIVKLLLCILGRNSRRNNHVLANLPVDGRSNALLVCSLKRVDDAKHFGAVSSSRRWVHHRQTHLLLRVDDKDGADGKGNALLGCIVQIFLVDHVVQEGHFSVVVGNDGEAEAGVCNLVNVLDPTLVRSKVIGALYIPVSFEPLQACTMTLTKPIILTRRASNSFFSLAKAPSSVVHTGV